MPRLQPGLSLIIAAAGAAAGAAIFPALAQATEPTGSYGLGVILGEPTGISAAYTLAPNATLDLAVAYSYARRGDWQIHSDYLFTGNRAFSNQTKDLDFYFGGGARLKFEPSTRFGLRVPGGMTYDLPRSPQVQFFAEIAPIVDFAPDLDLSINIDVGVRYFF